MPVSSSRPAGNSFDLLGTRVTVRVSSEEMENGCLVEALVPPSAGIPLHAHPYYESFYVLSGTLEFTVGGTAKGEPEWQTTQAGDCLVARADVPHAFRNAGREPARVLISGHRQHELFFRGAGTPVQPDAPFSAPPTGADVGRVLAIAEGLGMRFFPNGG